MKKKNVYTRGNITHHVPGYQFKSVYNGVTSDCKITASVNILYW